MAYDRFHIIILLAKELILVSDSCISFADLVILSGSAVCSFFYTFDSSACAIPCVVFYIFAGVVLWEARSALEIRLV